MNQTISHKLASQRRRAVRRAVLRAVTLARMRAVSRSSPAPHSGRGWEYDRTTI